MYASTNRYNISKSTNMISAFGGINDTFGCAEGEWRSEGGLSSQYFPALSSAKEDVPFKNLFFETPVMPLGMTESSDGFVFLISNSGIYIRFYNDQSSLTVCKIPLEYDMSAFPPGLESAFFKRVSFVESGTKTLIYAVPDESLRDYAPNISPIYVWVDRIKLRESEGEYGEATDITDTKGSLWDYCEKSASYTCSFQICTLAGEEYANVSNIYPSSPSDGQYVYDEEKGILYVYSSTLKDYSAVDSVYCKISAEGIDLLFERYDTVKIYAGDPASEDESTKKVLDAVCGYKTIHEKGSGYIIITADIKSVSASDITLKIASETPRFDFMFGLKNRIYGCRYGRQPQIDARTGDISTPFVNEIYVSALGSFTNWYSFEGISTDSYTASIGTGAEFTGAIAYNNNPIFFKKDRMYIMSGNHPADFTISEIKCQGVAEGGENTLAILNGVLYYLSPFGVCAYTGGIPQKISEAWGYEQAVTGFGGFAFEDKYYISVYDKGRCYIYIFDTLHSIWHRHEYDNLAISICGIDRDNIYALLGNGNIIALSPKVAYPGTQKYKDWYAESTDLGYSLPDKKYISLIRIRLDLEEDAEAHLMIDYDSEGRFEHKASIVDHRTGTYSLEIVPQRCDHYRLRLEGKGGVKILSIAYDIENGGAR